MEVGGFHDHQDSRPAPRRDTPKPFRKQQVLDLLIDLAESPID